MIKKTDYNLLHLNTFGIEEYCDEFYELTDVCEITEIPFSADTLILGGGSNLLLTGRLKQVVKINNKGVEIIDENTEIVRIKAYAGEILDDFVDFCVSNNFYGAENLSLIPGTIGAAPIQNIGAYGVEVKDIIESVEYFDITEKSIKKIHRNECAFDYRNSIFKGTLKRKAVVLSVNFILSKKPEFNLTYGGLQQHFSDKKPDLKSVRSTIIKVRNSKLPDYKQIGNCGSFYKNAIVNQEKLDNLLKKHNNIPFFKTTEGNKIPTAWLIETAGLKGYRHKNVGVYDKHSLILVNYGKAKSSEIIELSEIIENKVLDLFGIKLEKEVNII